MGCKILWSTFSVDDGDADSDEGEADDDDGRDGVTQEQIAHNDADEGRNKAEDGEAAGGVAA